MVILHAFLALVSGFLVIVVLAACFAALLKSAVPGWAVAEGRPSPGYVVASLGWSFLSAAAGGYVTARIGSDNPLYYALALAIIVLALSALSSLQARGKRPIWYLLAQVVASPLGVMAGGFVRLRVLGIL